jgi:amidohydrolase
MPVCYLRPDVNITFLPKGLKINDKNMNIKKYLAIHLAIVLSATVCFTSTATAQSVKSKKYTASVAEFKDANELAYADSSRLVEIFKDLHQNPELGFQETRTAAIVAKEFQALGYKVITGIGKTGVVGILKNGDGPVVLYRAEMDALPLKETTGLPYASSVIAKREDNTFVPVMHACGHDAHITWMFGVAKIMVSMKSHWKGTLVFVAQPAEELLTGAEAMVNDNMYGRGVPIPDYVFAMHTRPLPVGEIENCPGVMMAGSDQFDVTFHGIGGHGSAPHLAKDPVIMAATAILDYQSIVNRSISPQSPHVITVGSVEAGTANNIIPSSATLKVNLRWFTEDVRNKMIEGINRVDSSISFANNLPADLYPSVLMKGVVYPLKNDSAMVNKINAAFSNVLPADKIITNGLPLMGSEDFPLLIINSKKNPVYDYMWIGIANPELCKKASKEGKEVPFYNHNPNFQVDLSAIPYGTLIGTISLLELFKP